MPEYQAVVIGAGVVGTAIARALVLKNPGMPVAVLEKEEAVARHTSGRNSGVLHAGFNQKPGTLKARLCVEGNRLMRQFAAEHGVPVKDVGTVVVALQESQIGVLEEILKRGEANGVPGLKILDRAGLHRLEPNAKGIAALHAPSGAIVDNKGLVKALAADAKEKGVSFFFNQRVLAIERSSSVYRIECASSEGGKIFETKYLVNAAGLYADQVAHLMGVGRQYHIVPFRGEYYKIRPEKAGLVNSMIYPVPDLKYPFLGVHWTKKIDGGLAIGPNAVLALGRESYGWGDINWMQALTMITSAPFLRMAASTEFLRLAAHQLKISLSERAFLAEASLLVSGCRPEDLMPWSAGNRAQLITKQGKLVDDIVVEKSGHSLHVLNAVSPGFTTSLAFASHAAETLLE